MCIQVDIDEFLAVKVIILFCRKSLNKVRNAAKTLSKVKRQVWMKKVQDEVK